MIRELWETFFLTIFIIFHWIVVLSFQTWQDSELPDLTPRNSKSIGVGLGPGFQILKYISLGKSNTQSR